MPASKPVLIDKEHAERIRALITELHSAVVHAKENGLQIELHLNNLGLPTWNGYLDALKITRVL